MQDRLIPLDGPANFRDIGGYTTTRGETVRTGRVFRSDSLSFMSDEDVRHVMELLGLRTVIDLRGRGEVDKFTHGPLEPLGVTVTHMPILDETRRIPKGWDDGSVKPLDELYLMMLERFSHRFVAVVSLIAEDGTQPVVFHCAAGKDRTGLVAMLLLGLLGVDHDVIAADYAVTDERMAILLERHQARAADGDIVEVGRQNYPVDVVAMRAVIERLVGEYGSVEGYLLAHGLEPESVTNLRASLLA